MEDWEPGYEGLLVWTKEKGKPLTDTQARQIKDYCSYLYQGSGKINLIAEGDRCQLATKHVLPSLGLASLLAAVPHASVLDLGSGAGLPGIPLKIMFPESFFYLVESRRKRANFLRGASRLLGLERLEVCNERVEALHIRLAQAVDVVVSRATKNPADLLQWARPILKPYGMIIVTLDPERELKKAQGIILRSKNEWSGTVSWYGGVR